MKKDNSLILNEERRRIYGLETEYGLVFLDNEQNEKPEEYSEFPVYPVLPQKIETCFFQILAAICAIRYNHGNYNEERRVITNLFSQNGGRIYLDIGQHPETSTPECLTLREVVLYDKASERILETALKKTNHWIQKSKKHNTAQNNSFFFWLLKNNAHKDETYGSHENYMIRRQIPFQELADLLIPFLITRQIFCGSGIITKNGFEISQRARFINERISGMSREWRNNDSGRAIIHFKDTSSRNSNDITLANCRHWRRIHLILGDSNMSEYCAWLKLGTTALVLRMIDDQFLSPFCEIINPVESYHQISKDLTCQFKNQVILKDKSINQWQSAELTAVQIQELYLKKAQNYLRKNSHNLPPENFQEFQKIVREWKKVLKKIKINPMLLEKEVDWVIKKNLLEKYKQKHGIDWNHPDLKIIDMLYHHIDRGQGLYYLLEKEKKVKRIFSDKEIEEAKTCPPNTRAKWRAAVIELAEKKRIPYNANWNEIRFYPHKHYDENEIFSCLDPFYSGPPESENKTQKPIEIP